MQKTLENSIHIRGIGLHSGKEVSMSIHPAPVNTGFIFTRTDLRGTGVDNIIPARYDTVIDTRLCTKIGNKAGVTVATIEHLFAAFAARAIDNAYIDIDSVEVPAMDGSSDPYLFLIDSVGIRTQDAPRRHIKITAPIRVVEDQWSVAFEPADVLSITCFIDFPATIIGQQSYSVVITPETFDREIGKARTFAQMQEIDYLRKNGLALGGSYDNAVVVDGMFVLNPTGLRYDDEFVRHKILDAVGDIYLAGAPIIGKLTVSCSGHRANNMLLRALFANPQSYTYTTDTPTLSLWQSFFHFFRRFSYS